VSYRVHIYTIRTCSARCIFYDFLKVRRKIRGFYIYTIERVSLHVPRRAECVIQKSTWNLTKNSVACSPQCAQSCGTGRREVLPCSLYTSPRGQVAACVAACQVCHFEKCSESDEKIVCRAPRSAHIHAHVFLQRHDA